VLRVLLPRAERDEVLADLQAEFDERLSAAGPRAARRWARHQAMGSMMPLLRRGWWRGVTGFEPDANRMQPGGPMFETWIKDVRYSARRLARRPMYAALAIVTLALGAGGTAATYSIARSLLLDPLPIAREEQVGILWFSGSWNEREFLTLRPEFPGFQRMAAYRPNDVTLETASQPMQLLPALSVSSEFFDVLAATPLLGRTFRAGEDTSGSDLVVVLSHAQWQAMGADPHIVGTRVQLGGFSQTVVGVMPAGFWFPTPDVRAWTAAQMNPQSTSGMYTLVGRVAEGHAIAHMDGSLRALADVLAATFKYPNPQWDKTRNPSITPVREALIGDHRPGLVATFAAMSLILLIGCANVAALMLGQVDARATEMAVRAALGADRRRLVQQIGIEALILGLAAAVFGAALAMVGFKLLLQSLSLGAIADAAELDWTVWWASLGAGLAGSMLVAAVPIAVLWRGATLQPSLSTTRTGGVRRRGGRLEGGLVVAQIALAVLLASGAGLLIRTVRNLQSIEPGFSTRGAAVLDATMPARLSTGERLATLERAVTSLQALPGVRSIAATQKLPLRGSGDNWGIQVRGKEIGAATTAFRMVTRDYFRTLGVPIRRGRDFTVSDRAGTERVVVINEALAAKFFPGEDPIGRSLQTFGEAGERIIGVIGNLAEAALTDAPVPARYMLFDHIPFVYPRVSFVLTTEAEAQAAGVIHAARSALARDVRQIAVSETTTLHLLFQRAVGPAGHVVTLLSLLAGLALLLGAIGVYGVISHYVLRRSRDYGILIALGQPPATVVRQVMGRGAALVGVGAAIGVVSAAATTRLFSSLLYGVEATDPMTFLGAVGLLLATGMMATFIPARRASLTDPAVVLRQE
jgi:putative ABC transport system permease protein